MVSFVACEKELPNYLTFESYQYASIDETGGDWEPVYLTGTGLVEVDIPADTNTAIYKSELSELKSIAETLTDEQAAAVAYWGNNTIIRWFEITEELIAKYNLAPSPDANGEYGVPDPVFPETYPTFPFAHPPYASRAYAYLGASFYDALITAWHYKYMYNRPAPYIVDPSIIPLYPDNGLPSYPSEDAVIATVAEEMLLFLFPLEFSYIKSQAQQLRDTRLWAGMNVKSDIVAGDSIGKTIAEIFIGRAKADSMKFAQVEEDEYILLENNAAALWGNNWPIWENLEVPQRPIGITPEFGNVVPWWIPSVEAVRPGPPPAIGSDAFNIAKNELLNFNDNITREQEQIAYYWGDGFGTYTPAGHWNTIAKNYIIQYRMNPLRTARTYAYLNTAMMDAGISCWDTKYYYMYPRPPQADEKIKTLFGLPNFPSYTSGHSTFSAAAAEVLGYVFPAENDLFNTWAKEASESRIYSRIHFRFDCETGLTVGENIGNYAVTAAQADGAD